MKSVFVWNKTDFEDFSYSEHSRSIEEYFNKYFSPFKTIYSAKARHFIPLILELENLSRPNLIFAQPYSSHCVLSSVSYRCTPNTLSSISSEASIIYHQFGYKQIVNQNKFKNVIIEDSVDTFFLDKSKKEIFPNNANFSILSLPKLINSPIGSIAVCKDERSYQKLKNIINERTSTVKNSSVYSDLVNKSYCRQAILDKFKFITPIFSDLEKEFLISKSLIKKNIDIIKNFFSVDEDFSKRLPSNILIDKNISIQPKFTKYIQEPFRHIFDYNKQMSLKKKLIPVHRGIDWSKLL